MYINKLKINNYKVFKDFNISFEDSENKVIPVVIIAGINGSGKTSLLEYIKNSFSLLYFNEKSSITITDIENSKYKVNKEIIKEYNKFESSMASEQKYRFAKGEEIFAYKVPMQFNGCTVLKDRVIYFPSGIDDITLVSDEFVKTFYDFLKTKDYRPSEVREHFDKYMKNIFENLDISFTYSHLDKEDNVWFKNLNNDEFKIQELSTGEKTLLSKILYIYFKDYKDKIILIDEPELSLHPAWQSELFNIYKKLAEERNCQIIVATHSPQIINSANYKYLRFLLKEDEKIVVKQFSEPPLDRDLNTIVKTVMGADYLPKELEELHNKYRKLFDENKEDNKEAKELESKILEYESLNSSFFQQIEFDKALRG